MKRSWKVGQMVVVITTFMNRPPRVTHVTKVKRVNFSVYGSNENYRIDTGFIADNHGGSHIITLEEHERNVLVERASKAAPSTRSGWVKLLDKIGPMRFEELLKILETTTEEHG